MNEPRIIRDVRIESVSLVLHPPHPSWRIISVDGVPWDGPGVAIEGTVENGS